MVAQLPAPTKQTEQLWAEVEALGHAGAHGELPTLGREDKQKVGTNFTIFEVVPGLETNPTFCPPSFFLFPPASTSVAQKQAHRWSHFNVTSVLQLDPPHTTPISSPVGEVLWFLTSLSCDVSRWYSCAMIHVYIVLEHPTCLARVGDH